MNRLLANILGASLMELSVCYAAPPKRGATPPAPPVANPSEPANVGATTAGVAGFKLDDGLTIPESKRVGAGKTGPSYPFGAMKVGQSFLIDVKVPATITNETEKAKAFKDEARRISNRIGGAIKRFRKSNPLANFATRTVNDDTLGVGVRVWRSEDSAAQPQA
jgi:hypothetical protein